MTKQKSPAICDLCGEIINTDESYTFEIQKKTEKRGQFIKSVKGDLDHNCFKKFTKTGFEPKWIVMEKNETTGKWGIVDGS